MSEPSVLDLYKMFYKEKEKRIGFPFAESLNFESKYSDKNDGLGFSTYLADSVNQITNQINLICLHLNNLQIWSLIEFDKKYRLGVQVEFIDPLLSLLLSFPYAIKNRFECYGMTLCFQASLLLGWRKGDSSKCEAAKYSKKDYVFEFAKWPILDALEKNTTQINGQDFILITEDYRNSFHHNIPILINHGISTGIYIKNDENKQSITFGTKKSLDYRNLLEPLRTQYLLVCDAYKIFLELADSIAIELKKGNSADANE